MQNRKPAQIFKIADRTVGGSNPCYVIAEISCNHNGDFDEARRIIEEGAKAGADALKLQTYTADTITRNFPNRAKGTIWENLDLHGIYKKAHTPWEWHKDLKKVADDNGVHLFSSPFDETAVDFLVDAGVPVLKLASFEVVDTKLIEKMASTGLPVIMSNGMTDFLEMDEAVRTLRAHGNKDLAILHCNSGYPAQFNEANLKTIPAIAALFDCVVGLSDHTLFADTQNYRDPLAHVTPLESVRMGAKIIELHLIMDRAESRALMEKGEGGFDWPFSHEPAELKKMIDMIRHFEKTGEIAYETAIEREMAAAAHGQVYFEPTAKELASRAVRPSLWVCEDIKQGEPFRFMGGKPGNIDSIRPGGGLHVRYADFVNGKRAARHIPAGSPLSWDMIEIGGAAGASKIAAE